ncbi:hypothetical protein [Pseudonocardia xishanensis]
MTQPTGGSRPVLPTEPSLPRVAQDEAGTVGRSAADAGRQVAGTAVDQAAEVGHEARRQAKDLFAQARDQATEQARTGQRKAGESLRALASELRGMAGAGERSGVASDLAAQAAERLEGASHWLIEREPGDLVDEFRGFARRRPGALLLGAAAAGLLVGRLTRGAIDANRDTGAPGPGPGGPADATPTPHPYPPVQAAPVQPPVTPVPYTEPTATPYGSAPVEPGTEWIEPRVPTHAPRPGATTVGEYVDELERRGPQHPGDPR